MKCGLETIDCIRVHGREKVWTVVRYVGHSGKWRPNFLLLLWVVIM